MFWRWILGILLFLGLLIWRIRLGLRLSSQEERVNAELTVGPFRIPLTAKEKQPAPVKKATPKRSEKAGAPAVKKIPRPTLEDIKDAWRTLAPRCKRALGRTRRSIRLHPLQMDVCLAGGRDPAAAAELYGYAHAAVWTVMPALEQLLAVPDPHIHIGIDFDAEETKVTGELGISIRLGTLIAVGVGIGLPALRWFLRFYRRRKRDPDPKRETIQSADTAA